MSGIFTARVPSNIALIKYWGKRPGAMQWPANDSLSMTLNTLNTCTSVSRSLEQDHSLWMNNQVFRRHDRRFDKTFHQLDRLAQGFGFTAPLAIKTRNSFPMGAGIASSASGLGALTIAALAAWTEAQSFHDLLAAGFSQHKLADLSRQGSGSACRSLFGGFVLWQSGDQADQQHYESLYSADYWPLRDTVVLFSSEEKATGSTEAHELAWSSPLFGPRLSGIPERMQAVQSALASRKMDELGPWLEAEALEMHAVIMTASQPVYYLSPAALDFIQALRMARLSGELRAWFTIDAGPNIHLIHEDADHERLKAWLAKRLKNEQVLHDTIGQGPRLDFQSEQMA
ncbi:MAG: diphosphomevalonate decarboxylase [Proteobacteria bacterium]|nr:diphosphomevalonate decarboxylase [Pseudomonadota bacterium]